MSSLRIALLVPLTALAIGTQSPQALAQGQKHKVAAKAKHEKPGAKVDAAKMKAELESGDSARMIAALDELIKAGEGGASAAPYVASLLKRGASSEVLLKALEAAAALKQESTSSAVAPYVKHRLSEVRHAAAKALVRTKGADAVKALRGALRSGDAQVRGIAATGLGALGAKESLDDLYTALAHNVAEAAAAIGQLCSAKDCEKLAELTGKHPFDVMSSGFDQILFRPEKEMPEDEKIRIVGRLRELGTKEAGKYLNDVKGRWPKDWSKRVKQAIDSAVRATGGAGGED